MDNLRSLVEKAYAKDDEAILFVIQVFKPFMHNLVRQSNYSIEESDLILQVIHTINILNPEKLNKFESTGQIFNYFKIGIKNKYIQLLKQSFFIQNNEILFNENILSEIFVETENLYENVYIEELLEQLTKLQKKIIMGKFIYSKSDVEISSELNISRQSVNRIKNRALTKLRDYILQRE